MRIAIIGNGVAGITAARHIRKLSDHSITIVSDETDHFFSRTALMYIYMGHMTYEQTKPYEDWFWEKNRIDLVRDHVERIEIETNRLMLRNGTPIDYDVLLIATGSRPVKIGWPGQTLQGVQGFYSYQDLELLEENTRGARRAVIVGCGLIGMEMAEMLHSRDIAVTMLVREEVPWGNVLSIEEGTLIRRHLETHGIEVRVSTLLKEILDDDAGRARGLVTTDGDELETDFVALTVGVRPNIGVVKGSGIETNRGILVDDCLRTNIPNIYAAGDCAEFRTVKPDHPPVEQLWYTARMHGEAVARTICGNPTPYDRGIWFNSAKFFDIEFQTYGFVPPEIRDHEETFYWEAVDGRRAFRVVWNRDDRKVLGFNLFGIRYRQAVCEDWIRRGTTIHQVMKELSKANSDPEFSVRAERSIQSLFFERFGNVFPESHKDTKAQSL